MDFLRGLLEMICGLWGEILLVIAVGGIVHKSHVGFGFHNDTGGNPLGGAVYQLAAQEPLSQRDAVGLIGVKGKFVHFSLSSAS